MKAIRWTLTLLLLVALITGCAARQNSNPQETAGAAGSKNAGTPEAKALDGALVALQTMVDAGKKEDWAAAKAQFDAFGQASTGLRAKLAAKDPALQVRIEQAREELGAEFQPGKTPRAFELSEEGVKISKLLVDAAKLLELPINEAHLLVKLQLEPPFKQEVRVDVVLKDYAIVPDRITAPQGSKLILHVKNEGPHDHELAVAHYEREVELKPGESMDLVIYTLEAGEFELACHMPGHYEVGMKGTLTVSRTK